MTYPKKLNGLCIGVLSGDRILFQGPEDKKQGGYKQKILQLANITAPRMESDWGFAAREFLRKLLIGNACDFVIEKKVGQLELGYVLDNSGKNVSLDLLGRGLARVRSEKGEGLEEYRAAQARAEAGEKGIWGDGEEKRPIDNSLTTLSLFQTHQAKWLDAIVEEIHPSKAVLYFPTQQHLTTLNFSEVQVVVLAEKTQNEQKKNNVKAIRSTLQSIFLHRLAKVFLSSFDEELHGYLVVGEEDVRKVLLAHGFAKLGKEAMKYVSTKEFLELKLVAQLALEAGKGLWKEQRVNKSQQLGAKAFTAIVEEVHSGDSITLYINDTPDRMRVFLPNIRAPSFEAKEYLRRTLIGQKVSVEVEFSKKIKKEGQNQGRDFTFASVLKAGLNIGVALLENGLALLQAPRVEEDVSKYFEELREADEKAKKTKKGLHAAQLKKEPTFNDLSGGKNKKIDAAKCKTMFSFLKDQLRLIGVVELVLNGSRFKIRFMGQNVMAIVVLEGVRCLPNDGPFSKASEQALQYSKRRITQRDVQIELKKVDNKGVFHAQILLDQKDYASQLLEQGLAVCMGGRTKQTLYQQIESFARKNKIGLWKSPLNLAGIKGEFQRQFHEISIEKTGTLTEVIKSDEFYLQMETTKPEIPQDPKPTGPTVEVGQLYSAKFTDGLYYRARVVREVNGGRYHVHYIDYGNYDTVAKGALGILSQPLKKIKSPLYRCMLYGVQGLTNEGLEAFKELLGVELRVVFKEESQSIANQPLIYKVVLFDKQENINVRLIEFGEAESTIDHPQWNKAEENAKRSKEGKWGREQE